MSAPLLDLDTLRAVAARVRDLPADMVTVDQAAEACGVSSRAWCRWMVKGGVDVWTADRVAVHLGLHPCMIWPEWCEAADAVVEAVEAQRREKRDRYNAVRRARKAAAREKVTA